MASRKRTPDTLQIGFGILATPNPGPSLPPPALPTIPPSGGEPPEAADLGLDDLDDYDDEALHGDVPRLQLVDPPRAAPSVIVETIGPDRFEVSRLRDGGTTVACVTWTRTELEELQRRITAALEM